MIYYNIRWLSIKILKRQQEKRAGGLKTEWIEIHLVFKKSVSLPDGWEALRVRSKIGPHFWRLSRLSGKAWQGMRTWGISRYASSSHNLSRIRIKSAFKNAALFLAGSKGRISFETLRPLLSLSAHFRIVTPIRVKLTGLLKIAGPAVGLIWRRGGLLIVDCFRPCLRIGEHIILYYVILVKKDN